MLREEGEAPGALESEAEVVSAVASAAAAKVVVGSMGEAEAAGPGEERPKTRSGFLSPSWDGLSRT